jgi:hypothetical protein
MSRPQRAFVLVGLALATASAIWSCTTGQGGEGQACYDNKTCNAGLTCASQLCVHLDAGTDAAPDLDGTTTDVGDSGSPADAPQDSTVDAPSDTGPSASRTPQATARAQALGP